MIIFTIKRRQKFTWLSIVNVDEKEQDQHEGEERGPPEIGCQSLAYERS